MRTVLLALTLLACAGCGGDDVVERKPPTPLDHATTGVIRGSVGFEGPPPAMETLRMGSDATCAAQHPEPVPSGDVLVRDGKVENVFVWLKEGLGERVFPLPTEPVVVDQRGCLYHPHVAGAQTGQPIRFTNSDTLLHNVHAAPAHASGWNFSMARQGTERVVRVGKPEVAIPLRCDVHPWMHGYLGVVDHPYFAITGPDGRFTLPDVPPGDYVVAAWHERFGTREAHITLAARETKDVAFTYTAP